VIVFGKWKGRARGQIAVSGRTPEGRYVETLTASDHSPRPENGALRYLWARHRIALLSDYQQLSPDDDRVEAITKLGLDYNLLTAYTSFVAVDSEVRADESGETVVQPLPLPQGVPETAVGRGTGTPRMVGSPPPSPSALPDMAKGFARSAEPELQEALPEPEPAPLAYTVELVADKMVIQGALSGELVERVFRRHMEEIATCARGARESGESGKSEVTLRVVIGGDGTVQRVEIRPNGKQSPVLESCVSAMVRQWRYELPVDGQPVTVDYVFRLRPRS
jgi:Ca-activated chloride channel family protein